MSVQTQIDRINQNVANTYAVLGALGADMPAAQTSDNLAETAGTTKAVLYSAQTLTDVQKEQARENIGAVSNGELQNSVDAALTQAKESGEFDGADGERGTGVLRVTTAPTSYTTTTGGFTPTYRIELSTVKSQAGVSEVLVGDTVLRNYYTYPVGYVDASYVYLGKYTSIRGAAGTSVTITSITESAESGGENVVVFSDDQTLIVKNGKDGESSAADEAPPSYYADYLPTKIASVRALLDEAGSDASAFIFFSDTHQKQPYAPVLAKAVSDECGINHVIFAGDINGYSLADEATTLAQMTDAENDRYAPIAEKLLRIKGNHDGAYGTGANADDFHTTKAKVYSRLWRYNRADCYGEGGGYFYRDDAAEKTRYIAIDTFDFPEGATQECVIRQAQYDWLKNALNVEDGWSVICFLHVPPVPAYSDIWSEYMTLREFLGAYKNKTTYTHKWDGVHGGASGGYTNLFDASGSGFSKESDTKFLTNWMPYNPNDNDGKGTIYHFKGLQNNSGYDNPYKFHFAEDENGKYYDGTSGTALAYCKNANQKANVTADYDSSVKLFQHSYTESGSNIAYIQFEIRESLPANLIITANEDIIEASGDAGWDALDISADFTGYKGNFVAVFAGHIHGDYSYYAASYGGIDVHTICCDANQLDGRSYNDATQYPEFGGRQNGTVYEQALDVVVVNRKTRKINAVRIGAGYDREFSY